MMSILRFIFRIPAWKIMLIISFFYIVVVWLSYRQVERHMAYKQSVGEVFRPQINKKGEMRLFVHQCPIGYQPKHGHLSGHVESKIEVLTSGVCLAADEPSQPDIQMEKEWERVSVGYPQYVYTVSGWIQVLRVPNFTPKPLRVFIVPHSHQDPGWKETYEGYYNSYTRRTLTHMVDQLSQNPKLKFIWSEIVYLKKWVEENKEKKESLIKLIKNKQLEIVTGGWVMTDEAVSHYASMLNQLMDGHLWLKNTLGVVPNTSWSVDPFGHSPTMTYLLKRSGINQMVIQRTHFGIKRHFAMRQSLEFQWRQAWDSSGNTDVLCHMMPFLLYAIQYSCGPDPHVCCQFDFHRDKCFFGTETVPAVKVGDENIRKLSWSLWEQLQKKSELYQSKVLLVPHGDDFRYSSRDEWKDQFENLDKLMAYMNKDEDMNIVLEYGTVQDYFQALKDEAEKSDISFPSFSGDFFPYNDRDDQYWTGHYSVRPLLKHMARVLQRKLRITEILFVLTCAHLPSVADYKFYDLKSEVLKEARHALNLFHHHDAITGTSKKSVMRDYGRILHGAVNSLDQLQLFLTMKNLQKDFGLAKELRANTVGMARQWTTSSDHSEHPSLYANQVDGKWYVFVTNTLTISWRSGVTVRTSTPSVVKTLDGVLVRSQVNPVWGSDLQLVMGLYDIVFEADLPALSMKTYLLVEDTAKPSYAMVTLFGKLINPSAFIPEFKAVKSEEENFDIENGLIRATFSACTGTLQYTMNKAEDIVYETSLKMVSYGTGSWVNPFKDKSGAYIFMPDGQAKELESRYPSIMVIQGPVLSSVVTKLPGILHSASLYNMSGPVATGVHLDNLVDLSSSEWDNNELAMRIVSNVESPDVSVCVDLNGFQMHRKKWRSKLLIQGNFHPMTSASYIEDRQSRLNLLTSEAHGVASLYQGWLEVILDRRLVQDDWRGLNEGPHDNVLSPSQFILVPEKRSQPGQSKGPSCFPSTLAQLLANHLDNPPQVSFTLERMDKSNVVPFKPEVRFLSEAWPCAYDLVHLRYVDGAMVNPEGAKVSALMVARRGGLDCSFEQVYTHCQETSTMNLKYFQNATLAQVTELSLTGTAIIQKLSEFQINLKNMDLKTYQIDFTR